MKKTYFLVLVLNVFLAVTTTKIFLLTNNTLLNNGNWNSEKLSLAKGLMGSWNFFSQTQALNNNNLDLSAWHGFQEVTSKEIFQYDQLEFDALVDDEAYLITHFLINNDLRVSIKISDKPASSACLVIDKDGKFIEKTFLDNLEVKPNQWFHTKINLDGDKALIVVDNQTFTCDIPKVNQSKIGFRGGYKSSLIDNIYLKENNQIVFQEDFSNDRNFIYIAIFIFLCLLLFYSFFINLLSKKTRMFLVISITTSLLISAVISYSYLLFFFSGNYPNIKSLFSSKLRLQEQAWSSKEIKVRSNKLMEDYESDEHEKIMFIGSSQTWGAGASEYDKSFPVVFEKLVNESLIDSSSSANLAIQLLGISADQMIRVVNVGIDGQTSAELLHVYQDKFIKLKPKVLIINLSNNDNSEGISEKVFRRNIEEFIELNKNNNIKTILLVEANSIESNLDNPLHDVLSEVAADKKILLIDTNQYLKEKNGTGLIWWDFIHLTDYGYQLIAEYVLEAVF